MPTDLTPEQLREPPTEVEVAHLVQTCDVVAIQAANVARRLAFQRDALAAELGRLRAALTACEVVMDTAALHGLPQQLPPAYRDSWAAAHLGARAALGMD